MTAPKTTASPGPRPPGKLSSVRDTASFLGISEATLFRWESAGLIPSAIRIGRRTFWEVEALEKHIANFRTQRPAA